MAPFENRGKRVMETTASPQEKPFVRRYSDEEIDDILGTTAWRKPKEEGRGFMGHARDLGLSLGQGVIGVPEAAVGLADLVTGGHAGKFLENESGSFGFRPKQAREYLQSLKTDQAQRQAQEFEAQDGVLNKLGYALKNPSFIMGAVAESAPSMIGAGGLGRLAFNGIAKGFGKKAAERLAPVLGGVGEGILGAGQSAEQIRQESADGTLSAKQAGLAALSGVATGAFGVLGGKAANKLGIGDPETMLVKGMKGLSQEAREKAASSIPAGIIKGAISEGLLEELPQSVSEQILQNLALEKPWSEGVDSAAVMGVLAGGAMGAGAGGFHGMWTRGGKNESPGSGEKAAPGGDSPDAAPSAAPSGSLPSYRAVQQNTRPDWIGEMPGTVSPEPPGGSGAPPANPEPASAHAFAPFAEVERSRAQRASALPGYEPRNAPSPSQAMGLDPSDGPMSNAAVIAVDGGASGVMARAVPPAANPSANPQLADASDGERLAAVGSHWNALDATDRARILANDPDLSPIVRANAPNANFETLNPPLQRHIAQKFSPVQEQDNGAQTFTPRQETEPAGSPRAAGAETRRLSDTREQPTEINHGLETAQTQQAETQGTETENPAVRLDRARIAWEESAPDERAAIAESLGVAPIISRNMPAAPFDRFNPVLQARVAEVMEAKGVIEPAPRADTRTENTANTRGFETQPLDSSGERTGPSQGQSVVRAARSPIERRDDLVGAIMRVTGGKGISSSMAYDLIGEKANRAGNLRGLFTRMARMEADKARGAEKEYRNRIRQKIASLNRKLPKSDRVQTVGKKWDAVESEYFRIEAARQARKLELIAQREARAQEALDAAFDEAVRVLGEEAAQEILYKAVDLGEGLSPVDFARQTRDILRMEIVNALLDDAVRVERETREENYDAGQDETRLERNQEDARPESGRGDRATRGGQARARTFDESLRGTQGEAGEREASAFGLTGQTNAEAASDHAAGIQREKDEARANRQADARDRAEREQREIRERSEAAAKTFELGGDAEDNLSGQAGLFSGEPNEPRATIAPMNPSRAAGKDSIEQPRSGTPAAQAPDATDLVASGKAKPYTENEKNRLVGIRNKLLSIFRGIYSKPVTVESLNGDKIIVSYQGLEHALHGVPSEHQSLVATRIQDVIRQSSITRIEADKRERTDPKTVSHYETQVRIDGQPYDVTVVVRNHSDGNRYYDHAVMEKARQGNSESTPEDAPTQPFSELSMSVGELDEKIKQGESGRVAASPRQSAGESFGLRVGANIGEAEPVTVRDGAVFVGDYPAYDFETGEEVRVPQGASRQEIAEALKAAGALAKDQRFFGLNEADAQKRREAKAKRQENEIREESEIILAAPKASVIAKMRARRTLTDLDAGKLSEVLERRKRDARREEKSRDDSGEANARAREKKTARAGQASDSRKEGILYQSRDETPETFVPAPDGGRDYGEITPEMARAMKRQAGPIRLQQGEQRKDGTGWGLAHIEANHGKQIRNAGFSSVEEFVSSVASNFNQVLQTAGSQLLVAVNDGRQDVMFIQLSVSPEGDFYRVNTAFPTSRDYLEKQQRRKGYEVLWDGSEPASTVAGQQPLYAGSPESKSGQGAPIAQGQSSAESLSQKPQTGKTNDALDVAEENADRWKRLMSCLKAG